MPNFTKLNEETATVTSARWSRSKKNAVVRVWTPDNPVGGGNVSGFTAAPWPVVYFLHGGALNNPGLHDQGLETSSTALMLVNELSCALVSIDQPPGGFYLPTNQEPDAEFWPENVLSSHEAISWVREHATDASFLGSTARSLSTSPQRSLCWGFSAGGWLALQLQYRRDGDLPYSGAQPMRGHARFGSRHGSRCNFVLTNQCQSILSTHCKSEHASPAPSSYTLSGAHSSGVSSITVTGGTGRFLKSNQIQFNATGQVYAVTADSASPATTLAIYPTLQANQSGGVTVDLVTNGLEKYADYSWCGGYFFRQGEGRVWQRDVTSAAGDAEFDWNIKRQSDVDLLLTADNPRVKETNAMLIGTSGNTLIKSYVSTANEFSFRNHIPGTHGTLADGAIDAADYSLHGEKHSFAVAYILDAMGNTSNVALYVGNTTSNPDTEVGATNWNKGQNADFDSATFKAWLQDAARAGGAFA